jgi:CRP/FNR family transcriptional regulator
MIELIIVPLSLMEKWMTEHRSWYEFVIFTYRIRFEELLEVVDNIAFRAMDERLEFYLKRNADASGSKDLNYHTRNCDRIKYFREVISRLLKKNGTTQN